MNVPPITPRFADLPEPSYAKRMGWRWQVNWIGAQGETCFCRFADQSPAECHADDLRKRYRHVEVQPIPESPNVH